MSGTLYIVATPIGNLGDITQRAGDTLTQVDWIACEDTRRTLKLLNHLGIKKHLVRYDDHTHERQSKSILKALESGQSVALVTDAGTPAISDPGSRLVDAVVQNGFKVVPIPGASAPIAAVSAWGLSQNGFIFMGFLPARAGRAARLLQEVFRLGRTVVILESPFRLLKTLKTVAKIDQRAYIVIGREVTKMNEEFIRGPVNNVIEQLDKKTIKGEIVVMIGPKMEKNFDSRFNSGSDGVLGS